MRRSPLPRTTRASVDGPAEGAPPPSGGGGQQPPPPQGGQQPKPPEQQQNQNQGLTREQAEQILNSVEREERATRNRQLDRLSGGMGGAKDW